MPSYRHNCCYFYRYTCAKVTSHPEDRSPMELSVMRKNLILILAFLQSALADGDDFKPKPLKAGAWVHPSRGEIWPKPKRREKYSTFLAIDPTDFTIKVNGDFFSISTLHIICSRVSQISKIFGPTVFCVLLNERKLVRPSLGILRVIFHVGQASKAHWSGG